MTREELMQSGQVPPYSQLQQSEKEQLIRKILELIVAWRPIPESLLKPLPVELLRLIVADVLFEFLDLFPVF